MDMKRHLKSALKQLGFDKPRKAQIIPMNTLDAEQDAIVIAATGSGKQVIYETVGLAHSDKLTIVIEPLLALIYNQVQTLQTHDVSADYIDMTRSKEDIDRILHKARKGRLNFLYVTPERLENNAFIETMQHSDIFIVVVDECHCITEWGYTFRDAYLHIGDFINKLKHKPVICACSATISADSLNTIRDSLHMDKPVVLRSDLRRDNLILLKKDVTCNKKTLEERLEFRIKKLCKLIDKYHKDGSVLIFAQTTTYVDALYNILEEIYPSDVTRYHSQVKPEPRKKQLLFDFLQGKRKIMIATSAFSIRSFQVDQRCQIMIFCCALFAFTRKLLLQRRATFLQICDCLLLLCVNLLHTQNLLCLLLCLLLQYSDLTILFLILTSCFLKQSVMFGILSSLTLQFFILTFILAGFLRK